MDKKGGGEERSEREEGQIKKQRKEERRTHAWMGDEVRTLERLVFGIHLLWLCWKKEGLEGKKVRHRDVDYVSRGVGRLFEYYLCIQKLHECSLG